MNQLPIPVRDAFQALQIAIDKAQEVAEADIFSATQVRDFEAAQRALDRARALDQFRVRLRQFQADFEECVGQSIEATKATVTAPMVKSRPTPEIRHNRSHNLNSRARDEYYRPILETLVELGGCAEARVVLVRVYGKMLPWLHDDDLESLPSGGQRWQKEANFARNNMRDEGLLRDDSPRGIWEISEEGRAWLEKHYS